MCFKKTIQSPPNIKCSQCNIEIYRHQCDIDKWEHLFCSNDCRHKFFMAKTRKCYICGEEYKPEKSTSRYCSKGCANSSRKGKKYRRLNPGLNASAARLKILKDEFNFTCCMVEGCTYCKTYDIHRLIPGKEGGKYEIGNMYAICPNHHAEITRKIIFLEKTSNCLLKIRKDDKCSGETVCHCDEIGST